MTAATNAKLSLENAPPNNYFSHLFTKSFGASFFISVLMRAKNILSNVKAARLASALSLSNDKRHAHKHHQEVVTSQRLPSPSVEQMQQQANEVRQVASLQQREFTRDCWCSSPGQMTAMPD
ncbi:hypothetical protein CDAR_421361 [Caerostris darwini]|uniref:Uncharacterized protein n=1 Tax=Caerostris darwini TaxID=1538125 RepID=A0AAV4SWP0_9ARAC|nr:hypothetical protein CDAR_421361 [Caerostris darwini]